MHCRAHLLLVRSFADEINATMAMAADQTS